MSETPAGGGSGEPGPATPTRSVPARPAGRGETPAEPAPPAGGGFATVPEPASRDRAGADLAGRDLAGREWEAAGLAEAEPAGSVLTAAGDPAPEAGQTVWEPPAGGWDGPPPAARPAAAASRLTAPRRWALGHRPRPRGRTRWRTACYLLAAVAVVAGVSWALLGDRLLVVRSVAVSGTHLVAPQQVIGAAAIPDGTPLMTVDSAAVARRVEALRQVASVRVTRDWPDRLTITVTERIPVMAVKMAGGGYDLVDRAGVIVRWTKSRPAPLPLLSTTLAGRALAASPSATTAAGVLAELQPALAKQVKQVRPESVASGTEQVTLNLRDGQTIQWGGTDNAAQKNRELSVLLPRGARDIDVSSPGTVVTH